MDRREFFTATGAGAVTLAAGGLSASGAVAEDSSKATHSKHLPPLKARLGHQLGHLTEKNAAYLARFGVEGVCPEPEIKEPGRIFNTVEELSATRELAEKHGLKLEMISSVLLTSSHIDHEPNPAIMLAQSPQRDRDIEAFQTLIKNCAATGIPALKYNMSILGVVRSSSVPGRGDSVYWRWNYDEAVKAGEPPPTKAGMVNADAFWERIDYFLKRVVPVANEYKVRIACHPQDPGMPQPKGWQGVDRVLGTIDGLKKFISMYESPYHGLNFCQGTISEDLEDPNAQIGDVIRYFGTRKKIFNVHFRNIRGHRNDFDEVFPDNGSVDFVKAIKVYREVGYDQLLMPDHAPRAPGDPAAQDENFAFAFGYIRGLIQSEQHVA
jgi:mannonate dehydratase